MADRIDLKQAGLKSTLPRLKILSIFENSNDRHVSAEDVFHQLHKQGENLGLATIYRVLTQFEAAGLIIRHNFEGERSVFEVNDDLHHDHMICVQCCKVIEFFDKEIESQQLRVAEEHDFIVNDHALTLYGTCKQCSVNTVDK